MVNLTELDETKSDEPGRQPWGRFAVLPSGCSFRPGPYSFVWGRGVVQSSASSSDWVSPWGETPSRPR